MDAVTLRGQDEALDLLYAGLSSGRAGHAYLFHGPAGVGKTRAALEFARALLCESPRADRRSCGVCASCRDALRLRHPDLELLVPLPSFRTEGRTERQAEESRSEARARVLTRTAEEPFFTPVFAKPAVLSVEDLARGKQFLSLTARREDGAKVLIMKRAEAMTHPAAHAFLKILEEPQPGRVLILCARQPRSLLSTVVSRCLPVRFRPLPLAFIAETLSSRRGVSAATARLLAATAQGSLGAALERLETPLDAASKEAPEEGEVVRLRSAAVDLFVRPKTSAVLGPLRRSRLDRDRTRFLSVVAFALHYYRDVLRVSVLGDSVPLAHEDLKRDVLSDAKTLPKSSVTGRLRVLEEIADAVQSNVTIPYAVASAQHRMGLHAGGSSSREAPARRGDSI
jgi:DNA polymerase III subunit delta'